MKRLIVALGVGWGLIYVTNHLLLPRAPTESKVAVQSEETFPESLFSSAEGDGKPGFHYFAANPVDAKFLVGAWDNRDDETPEHFKRWMITNAGGYEEVTYQPRGRSWFVLSGYRGEQIYYEKVMFSCGGRIVNILAIAYPTAERALFDPIVERMEDTFKPSRECAHQPQAG
jgi:hypothetical protein